MPGDTYAPQMMLFLTLLALATALVALVAGFLVAFVLVVMPGLARLPDDEADFNRKTYRRRCVVECCIGWLKECRAVATCFEKLAVNFIGTVRLAIIGRYLRILDSSDSA